MATADRAVLGLARRELQRGIVLVVVGAGLMFQVIVASFDAAFSAGATGALSGLVDNPAVRALYGVAYDVSTAGGFAVWRGGTFVCVVGALWASLATVRVLRGEEDLGRWDLLLAEPVSSGRAVAIHLLVLLVGCTLLGAAIAAVLLGAGQPVGGSVLYGTGVGLLAATGVGLGALSAQLFGQRRRAAGFAGGAVGVLYGVRMLADASSGLSALRWLTPFGWVEELRAFAGDHPLPLIPLLLAPVALLLAASWARARRDLGSGLLADRDLVRARRRLLGGVVPFAWRQRLGGVVGWGAGVVVYGAIIGAITASFTDWIAGNQEFQDFAARYGIGDLTSPVQFVAFGATAIGLILVLQVTSALHHGWEDENEGRLELYHSLPMTRSGWLGAEVITSLAAVVLTGTLSAVATWAGAVAGGADVTLVQALAAIANTASILVLFAGLAVLLHGVWPQVALPLSAGLAVVAYFLGFLGPAANLPDWVVSLSPFHHLATVPAEPVAWVATVVMVAAGVALAGAGFAAYARRDLA
jgi:ABC-2 type transport system permease protein